MEWFRDEGHANVMLSVKALIEGVDVPSADVGIIRVSNSSIRQRIQTFGRVLRTGMMHLNNLSYTYSMREILSTNGCSKNTTGTSNWQVLKLITCIGNQKMVYSMGNYERLMNHYRPVAVGTKSKSPMWKI